jgi:hypothetical protein
MEAVIGGTPSHHASAYAARSPSHHLAGLAAAITAGGRFVPVWSLAASEQREFHGATCSKAAYAKWLAELATLRSRPVPGYVTNLRHGHALWDLGSTVMALAGIGHANYRRAALRRTTFTPEAPPSPNSYCAAGAQPRRSG